jgi:hypothetical protein
MSKGNIYAVHRTADVYDVSAAEDEMFGCGAPQTAQLIGALMNGDLDTLATATEAEAAICLQTLKSLLAPFLGLPRPALPVAFPLM